MEKLQTDIKIEYMSEEAARIEAKERCPRTFANYESMLLWIDGYVAARLDREIIVENGS